MKYEDEVTVEINTSLDNLIKILEQNNFELKEVYDINDIYLINRNDKENDILSMLNKCVLIRDIIEEEKETKMLTYKYKEYNDNKEIIKNGKIKVNIDNVNSSKLLFEKLNFEELIKINDHMLIYANNTDEIAIQVVNNKHIYIEIEGRCNRIDRIYNSIEEMKGVITKYSIPIKNNDYFVKKAEIELKEKYNCVN